MKKNILVIAALFAFAFHGAAKDGLYLEFKITSTSMNGTSKSYVANGSSRNEVNIKNSAMPAPMAITTLILANRADTVYTISEKDKTFSGALAPKTTEQDYVVTVVGKERIDKYNCTHVSILYKKSKHTVDMWVSKDIPGYARYTEVTNDFLAGITFFNTLKKQGVEGFTVRIVNNIPKGEKLQLDLVKAEKKKIKESLFSLSGYKRTEMVMPGSSDADMRAMNGMTPQEREMYLKKVKERYQTK